MTESKTTLVGIAAIVSVITSFATVAAWGTLNARPTPDPIPAERLAKAEAAADALTVAIAQLQQELVALKARSRRASAEAAAEVDASRRLVAEAALRREVEELESARRGEAEAEVADEPAATEAPKPLTREELRAKLAGFKALGFGAYGAPGFQAFASKLKELGPEAIAFVAEELNSDDPMQRFLAAGLAEKLQAVELIPDLEKATLQDDNFIVRRMSSHALAFMGDERAVDSLVKIVQQETRDMGVSLNAWYGLADQRHPEAYASFSKILDAAGGEVSPDLVVDTAIKLAKDPGIHPLLRDAYERENVSVALKARILGTLGAADDHGFDPFLQSVADDADAAPILRDAAQRALDASR